MELEQSPSRDRNELEKSWYKVNVLSAHVGAGKKEDRDLYVWAENPMKVVDYARRQGGWHRSQIPTVTQLDAEEISELELKLQQNRENDKLDNYKKRLIDGRKIGY